MPVELPAAAAGGESKSLEGKVALVTGGSSGVGFEVACGLARQGCKVVITSRSKGSGVKAVVRLLESVPEAKFEAVAFDAGGSITAMKKTVEDFKTLHNRLDILIFNAGGLGTAHEAQDDGIDKPYMERVASNQVLTSALWDLLVKSGTAESPSRVITISGMLLTYSKTSSQEWLELGRKDIGGLEKKCSIELVGGGGEYEDAWVAALSWARAMGRSCQESKVPVLFLVSHPGVAAGTNLDMGRFMKVVSFLFGFILKRMLNTAQGSAQVHVAAASLPDIPQSSLLGPLGGMKGPPAIVDLDTADGADAKTWKTVAGPQMFELGGIVIKELEQKTGMKIL